MVVWMNSRELTLKLFHGPKHYPCDKDVCHNRNTIFMLISMEHIKNRGAFECLAVAKAQKFYNAKRICIYLVLHFVSLELLARQY